MAVMDLYLLQICFLKIFYASSDKKSKEKNFASLANS